MMNYSKGLIKYLFPIINYYLKQCAMKIIVGALNNEFYKVRRLYQCVDQFVTCLHEIGCRHCLGKPHDAMSGCHGPFNR